MSSPKTGRNRLHLACVGLLLATHGTLAITATLNMSATCDELLHLTAGYSYWITGDYRLVQENPPLPQLWAAAPLVLDGPVFPGSEDGAWRRSDPWPVGRKFLFEMGNDADSLLLRGRCMIALFSTALGIVVYLWSRRLFGPAGGLVSLTLFAFSPTMLAHAAQVTTDMAAGLFFLLSVAGLWAVLHRVSPLGVLMSALAVAGLVLSKLSGLLILPMAAGLVLVRLLRHKPLTVSIGRSREVHSRAGQLGVFTLTGFAHVVLIWCSIWAMYGLRFEAFGEHDPGRDDFATFGPTEPYQASWDYELGNLGRSAKIIRWARDHRVLPESFLYGLALTLDSTRTRPAFLNGDRSARGFLWFFPWAFLFKTPLPLFGVIALALVCASGRSADRASGECRPTRVDAVYRTAPLWMLLLVYWGSAITSHINIGHRHLLPVYAPMFILCGSAAALLGHRRRVLRWSVPAMLAVYSWSSLAVWPHSLAFFNALVGGPASGYRHLVDSSLDWGQDLKRLKHRLQGAEPVGGAAAQPFASDAVYLSYTGSAMPEYYGIQARILPPHMLRNKLEPYPLGGGLYCISATALQQVYLLPTSGWTPALERVYKMCLPRIRRLQRGTVSDTLATGFEECRMSDQMLGRLRFGRLCAALRRREPDDRAGYSIMIYRLTQEQIDEALFGPPVDLEADTAEGLCQLALQLQGSGQGEPATEFLQAAVSMEPDEPHFRLWLAHTLHRQGRLQEALEHYRQILRTDPEYRGVHAGVGAILAQQGQLTEAVRAYHDALRIDPRDTQAYANLAFAYAALGRGPEAVAACRRAMDLRPRDPTLRLNLADVHAQLGRFEEAVAELKVLTAAHPNVVEAYPFLVALYERLNRISHAIGAAEEGVKRGRALGRSDIVDHLTAEIARLLDYSKDSGEIVTGD